METAVSNKDKFIQSFLGQPIPQEQNYLIKVKDRALSALESLPLPTTKDEYWKYTRTTKIIGQTYRQNPRFDTCEVEQYKIPHLPANYLVFIGGIYSEKHSQICPEDASYVKPLALAKKENASLLSNYYGTLADDKNHLFTALNSASSTNGLFLHLPKNAKLKNPIQVISISDVDQAGFNPRHFVYLEQEAKAEIIFTYNNSKGHSFSNSVLEGIVNDHATLNLYRLQQESLASFHINTLNINQKESSIVNDFCFTTGGDIVRNNLNIKSEGSNTQSHLLGLYLTSKDQHVDNHTFIHHTSPHCESNENYKGILKDSSTAVFNGKVMVDQLAQKTNAYQSNRNIILGDKASINSKPELEIYADDVKCSHGCTVGQMNKEALFYLQSRGIPILEAQKLMVTAFASEVLDQIENQAIKTWAEDKIEQFVNGN